MMPSHASPAGKGEASMTLGNWRRIWTSYDIGNWLLLLALIIILVIIEMVEPRHRYIMNINDPAINYPLVPEQVPLWLLILLVEVFPILCILAVWIIQRKQQGSRRELYHVLFAFCFAMVTTLIITEFSKRVTGRPRPNFVQLSGYTTSGTFTASASRVGNAYRSFPSGHTSTAFSGLGFLSIYLFRLTFPLKHVSRDTAAAFHSNQAWKTVLCIAPLFLATWIGLTRIVDYFHSFDDVAVGALLGFGIAVLFFELHVNWLWTSIHPTASSALTNNGAAGRRWSGDSGDPAGGDDPDALHAEFGALASPSAAAAAGGKPGTGRKQVLSPENHAARDAAVAPAEEDMDAPLIDRHGNKV